MKHALAKRLLITLATVAASLIGHNAAADYRVTAFGETTAYGALLSRNVEAAQAMFSRKSVSELDFGELNNLCVTQILARELDDAIASCDMALKKLASDLELSMAAERSARSSILSNMAVARAMSGDLVGASSDIEKALLFNAGDRNANSNRSLISSMQAPTRIAQSL